MFKRWISILGNTDNKKIVNVAVILLAFLLILHLARIIVLDSNALILIAFIVMLTLLPYTEYIRVKDIFEWKRRIEKVEKKVEEIKLTMAKLTKPFGSFSGRLKAENGTMILGLFTHEDIFPSFDITPVGRDDLEYRIEKVGRSTYKVSFFDTKGNPVQEDIEFDVIATWQY